MLSKNVKMFSLLAFSISMASLYGEIFNEIPFQNEEKTQTNQVILQYEYGEGDLRVAGATMEIGSIDDFIKDLETSLKKCKIKNKIVSGFDFSNTDIVNDELEQILTFLNAESLKLTYLNLSETGVDYRDLNEKAQIMVLKLLGENENQDFQKFVKNNNKLALPFFEEVHRMEVEE